MEGVFIFMKKLIPLLLLVFILMGSQAAMGSTLKPSSGVSMVATPNAFQTLYRGECQIINNGNGIINISGLTSTYYAVEKIGLTLNLQQYSNGSWYTIGSYPYSRYDTATLSGGQTLGVSKGNFYRVLAQHSSIDGSLSENGISYSAELYIN
jgi:hypothetical protein